MVEMAFMEAKIMNMRKDRRKTKRAVNQLRKKAGYGKYVLDCRGHPSQVIEVEFYSSDLYGNGIIVKSLLDGVEGSCSLLYCRPDPLTEIQAKAIKEPVISQEAYNALNL